MKKIILIAASAFFALSGFAQERALKNYGFQDNWFIQGQLGGSYSFGESHTKVDFFKRVSPHVALSIGKHFSPVAGARLQVGGWEAKTYLADGIDSYKSQKFNYIQANLDALINLTNLFYSSFEGEKSFNLYGIFGIGYGHVFADSEYGIKMQNNAIPRAGLQADFRITNDLSVNLEAVGNLMPDQFNGRTGGRKYDATLNTLIGLTYRFNKSGFELVETTDPEQIASLNAMINRQKTQLLDKDREVERLKAELAKKPVEVIQEPVIREDTEVLMNAVVVFRIGSAKLEQNQDINIYNAAKYLQDNPNVRITVTGYADKATGTPAINQRLSEQRAKAVADIMIKKYGISADRITVEASGDREQPFQIDAWNRVVIFRAK